MPDFVLLSNKLARWLCCFCSGRGNKSCSLTLLAVEASIDGNGSTDASSFPLFWKGFSLMKYKFNLAGQCANTPGELVDYLNSVGCAIDVFDQVGNTCLNIPVNEPDPAKGGFGPAERFLQFVDFTADNRPFILTSISLANEKEDRDFDKAIKACEVVTIAAIMKYWATAGRVQIYVQCALSNAANTSAFLKEHVSYYIDAATGEKSENQFHDPLEEREDDKPFVSPTWKMERTA